MGFRLKVMLKKCAEMQSRLQRLKGTIERYAMEFADSGRFDLAEIFIDDLGTAAASRYRVLAKQGNDELNDDELNDEIDELNEG